MKLSIVVVFAFACVFAFAQSDQAQDEAQQTVKQHSMTGCLQAGGTPNIYVLGAREWGGPREATIVSSSADLASYVRQKVEITGIFVPAKEAEAKKNVPKAFRYMNVTAIKTISATCR